MKIFPKLAMLVATLLLLSGCGGTSALKTPEKAGKDEKIKIYVVSHTPEKFKNMETYQAIWNGIAPLVIKYNQIMQCDMTPETVLTLQDMGLEIVNDPAVADYRLDTAVEACGIHTHIRENGRSLAELYNQRTEVPLKEKPLYRDLKHWVESGEAPATYADILKLFDTRPDMAMRHFHMMASRRALYAMSDEGNWGMVYFDGANYQIAKTKGYLYPHKYRGVSDEQKAFLEKWMKAVYKDKDVYYGSYDVGGPVGFVNVGRTLSNSGHEGAGAAMAALGVAQVLFGKSIPTSAMSFRLTRLSDNKTVRHDDDFLLYYHYDFGSPLGHNVKDEVEDALDELFDKMNET